MSSFWTTIYSHLLSGNRERERISKLNGILLIWLNKRQKSFIGSGSVLYATAAKDSNVPRTQTIGIKSGISRQPGQKGVSKGIKQWENVGMRAGGT